MLAIGIDVGINGGLAAIGPNIQSAAIMPIFKGVKGSSRSSIDIVSVRNWIKAVIDSDGQDGFLVCIEQQQAMPKQGVVSMFNLGDSYGQLKAMAKCLDWPMLVVRPKIWKDVVLTGTTKDKTAAIIYASQKYPSINLNVGVKKIIHHDGMADAVCIAQYALTVGMGITSTTEEEE